MQLLPGKIAATGRGVGEPGRAESAASAASCSPSQLVGEGLHLSESPAAASSGVSEGCRGSSTLACSQANVEAAAATFASLACSSHAYQQDIGPWPGFGPTSIVAMPVHVSGSGTAGPAEARRQAAAEERASDSSSRGDVTCTPPLDATDRGGMLSPEHPPDADPAGVPSPPGDMKSEECSSVPGSSACLTLLSDTEDELLTLESPAGPPALLPSGRAGQRALHNGSSSAHSRRREPLLGHGIMLTPLSSSDSEEEAELQRLERKYNIVQQRGPVHGASRQGVASSRQRAHVRLGSSSNRMAHAACTVSVGAYVNGQKESTM